MIQNNDNDIYLKELVCGLNRIHSLIQLYIDTYFVAGV